MLLAGGSATAASGALVKFFAPSANFSTSGLPRSEAPAVARTTVTEGVRYVPRLGLHYRAGAPAAAQRAVTWLRRPFGSARTVRNHSSGSRSTLVTHLSQSWLRGAAADGLQTAEWYP